MQAPQLLTADCAESLNFGDFVKTNGVVSMFVLTDQTLLM